MLGTLVKTADVLIDGKKGPIPALEVLIRKANGEEKAYRIPKFLKSIVTQFADINPGDNVDVSFENKGGYMNISGVEKYEGEITPTETSNASPASNKGGWRPDPNKDRGVSLRYAVDAYGPIGEMSPEEYAFNVTTLADLLLEYITDKSSGEPADADAEVPTPDA